MKNIQFRLLLVFIIFLNVNNLSFAQDEQTLRQANNPLANIKALNFHNFYLPSLYGADNASVNQLFIRYAQPIGRVLLRATLPVTTMNYGNGQYKSGLGDFNIFGAYLFSNPAAGNQFGAGPLLTAPTARSGLGPDRWQAGLAIIVFMATNPRLQYGGLITWQTDFAGNGNTHTNAMNVQPFAMWQLGGGTYLRSSSTWTFNFRNGGVNIPFGFGVGRVIPVDKTVFNLFVEPQYSVYNEKFAGAKFQIMTGINTQF